MKKLVAVLEALLFTAAAGCTKAPPPSHDGPKAGPSATPDIAVVKQATTISGSAVADSTLFSEAGVVDGNYGGSQYLCVGHQQNPECSAGGQVVGDRRAVLKFALPPVPANQAIFGGTMTLSSGGSTFNITALELSEAFSEGTIPASGGPVTGTGGGDMVGPCGHHGSLTPAADNTTSQPSAVFQSGSVSWTHGGSAAWSVAGGATTGAASPPTTSNVWDIGQILRNWYGGQPNNGILLVSDIEGTSSKNVAKINSRENATSPPRIDVEFRNAGGTGCSATADCAFGLSCVGGICCQSSTCDDGNPCTVDSCQGPGGTCRHTTVTCTSDPNSCVALSCNGTATCTSTTRTSGSCSDGNLCTFNDTCNSSGTCVGTPITCTSNPSSCTTLSCNGTSTCASAPRTSGSCNDGNLCTFNDTCNSSGTCVGTAITCTSDPGSCATLSCNGTSVCATTTRTSGSCSDGNLCTFNDTCNSSGACVGTAITCTSNPNSCTTLSCNGTSTCASAPRTSGSCSDGNLCTFNDTCNSSGACVGTAITCASNPNSCTTLSCNGTSTCASAPRTSGSCNDSNLCTFNDACDSSGTCVGTPITCTSNPNSCTTLSCNGTSTCASAPRTSGSCDDGNLCTHDDTCNSSSTCAGTAISCTSNPNSCTTLSCNGTATCSSAPRTSGSCNDGNLCTFGDTCNSSGTCVGTAVTCTSNPNSCTTLSCNGTSSCASAPRTSGSCNDGNLCTHTDTCNSSGACVGTPIACTSDPKSCSTLSCNGTPACASTPRTSGSCDDGNACTHTDTCNASGNCVGTGITCTSNPNSCVTLSCDGTATCASTPRTSGSCNDGNACTFSDTCSAQASCVGTAITCTSDACNTRSCNGTSSCTVTPLTGPSCNDNNLCTRTDACSNGVCVGGNPVVCTPSDQCHDAGTCAAATGTCSNPVKAGTPSCDDGQACTVGEKCQNGVCGGGSARDCSASATDDCHAGQCAEPSGCFSEPLTGNACDDGNACTVGTTCNASSVCSGGTALNCDDGDPCTTDSCNPASGCVHGNATDGTPCATDSNPCTRDTCVGGVCHTPSPSGTPCGAPPSCTGMPPAAVATPAGACNGTSTTCAQNPISCGSQPCNGTTCLGACTADTQCSSAQFCDLTDGQCKTKLGAGAACARTAMCNALTCVDGVCCTSACAGGPSDCQTCNGTSPGTCTTLPANTPCNDGLFCDGTDKCNASGVCNVSAGNPCPGADGDGNCAESCNETTDSCTAPDPNGSACNDGLFCNVGETCQSGVCTGGSARDCSVFTDQCNVGVCNEGSATCQASPVTGTSCNADNSLCTSGDQCLSGVCQPGPALNCNDNESCTTDSCTPAAGCIHTARANGSSCNVDGNPCTLDTCVGGVCNTPAQNGAPCGAPPSCSGVPPNASEIPAASCQNGNCTSQTPIPCGATVPCNGTRCQGGCTADAECAAGFFCNVPQNACQPVLAPGGACTRNTMCQPGTTCVDGVCCTSACGGGATTDCVTCNGQGTAGTCTNLTGTPCDDGLFCNGTDTCNAGVCNRHGSPPCPGPDGDGNCKESCNEATDTCNANDPAGSPCNDGSFCTVNETCDATGTCGGGTPRDCTSLTDQCNTGACDETNDKCKATPLTGNPCDDGSSCTSGDKCTAGVCAGVSSCDDGNPCTDDACGTGNTCIHTANTASCDDKNKCTTGDKCANKVCVPGAPTVCDDGKPCTDDACDPVLGCQATNDDTNTCTDGNACTSQDHCVSGACIGGPATSCDDTNPCTTDTCDPAKGCQHANNTAACDDGDACTTLDKCSGGACIGGPARVCNDEKPCTVDTCSPAVGCVFAPGNAGVQCRAANGVCDDPENCNGTNPDCPLDTFNTGRTCSPGSCTLGRATPPGTCNGASATCPAVTPVSCGNYVCSGTVCGVSCTTGADCAQGTFCDATHHCNDKLPIGEACTSGGQCASTFCVDGVCCNAACSGQCEACNLVTLQGTCSPVTGDPVGPRAPCPGTDAICKGTCNGIDTLACAVPDGSVLCRAASCDATLNQVTPAAFCSGGSCPASTPTSCAPSVCIGSKCSGCVTDVECGKGNFCDLATDLCKSLLPPGGSCTRDRECGTGQCVDNVCCDSDCTGQCETCAAPGHVGTCVPVTGPPVGRKPCSGAAGVCAGTCDGTNRRSCVYAGPGTVCTPPSCSGNRAIAVAFCDGAGSCPPDTEVDCPAGCDGDVCAGQCGCNVGQRCAAGICIDAKKLGDPCNTGAECHSSYCSDGVCCDQACTGQCEACNLAGTEGTCTASTGEPKGARQPCASDGSACRGVCDGSNRTQCVYPGVSTECRPASCRDGVAILAASCQANGSCGPLQVQDCSPNACSSTEPICANGCTKDADCSAAEFCSAGVCIAKLEQGTPCGSSAECASTHCVDGLCCDTACTGQCEACDQAAKLGTCTGVSGAPRQGRPACAGLGACGGFCTPTDPSRCTLPSGTTCGTAACQSGFATPAPVCLNAVCVSQTPTSCDLYTCTDTGDACTTSCENDSECARGAVCIDSSCTVPGLPDAGADGGSVDAGAIDGGSAGAPDASPGTGGKRATGGARGSGGKAGAGGSRGTSTEGGVGVDAGADASRLDAGAAGSKGGAGEQDTGGCGCRVPGGRRSPGNSIALPTLAALIALRRRRRPDMAARP